MELELDDGVEARRARLDAHVGLDRLRVGMEELVRERLARRQKKRFARALRE